MTTIVDGMAATTGDMTTTTGGITTTTGGITTTTGGITTTIGGKTIMYGAVGSLAGGDRGPTGAIAHSGDGGNSSRNLISSTGT
jgi:hypothetical protein